MGRAQQATFVNKDKWVKHPVTDLLLIIKSLIQALKKLTIGI